MLDINFIRENAEFVKKAVKDKRSDVDIDQLLSVDTKRRELTLKVDSLRQERNQVAEKRDIERGKQIKQELEGLEKELEQVSKEFKELMLKVPNLPFDDVPDGGEDDYEVIRTVGDPTKLNFEPKDHLTMGETLDIIDVQRAAKVSGSRFAYLKNEGALLELALAQYAMQKLYKNGFSPILPPTLIKQNITEGLGYWQVGGNENYYLVEDFSDKEEGSQANPLYLIGTGEHSVVPMHMNETLEEKNLPKKYVAFSSCYRREAGTYGKDTRGILRVHQFEKVEMVALVKPDEDETVRRQMLSLAEGFLSDLNLPYRVIKLAKGDISFPAAETIDIETWIPSQNKYRETHSISTTTNFQSRRLNIRFKSAEKGNYVHILNGTAMAIGRLIIAILENYQQEDGSVKIPEALVPYTGFSEIRPK